jgi:adenylate kinase family enzyme
MIEQQIRTHRPSENSPIFYLSPKSQVDILVGPTFAGKGTLRRVIAREVGSEGNQNKLIGTGDVFRGYATDPAIPEEVKRYVRETMAAGGQIKDQFVTNPVRAMLRESDADVVTLDGYPRNALQYRKFENIVLPEFASERGMRVHVNEHVIGVSKNTVIERTLKGRDGDRPDNNPKAAGNRYDSEWVRKLLGVKRRSFDKDVRAMVYPNPANFSELEKLMLEDFDTVKKIGHGIPVHDRFGVEFVILERLSRPDAADRWLEMYMVNDGICEDTFVYRFTKAYKMMSRIHTGQNPY